MPQFNHINLNGRTKNLPYSTYGGGNFVVRPITNRVAHGRRIKQSFENSVNIYTGGDNDFDFIYLEFESAGNFQLDIDKFENARGDIHLASCKIIKQNIGGVLVDTYKSSVYISKQHLPVFLRKIDQYISENTISGAPRYNSLFSNIEEIRAASLESFWQEVELPFPDMDDDLWWEVWFLKTDTMLIGLDELTTNILNDIGIRIGQRVLVFPEHIVLLIKGTGNQLASSVLNLPNLAELRKPIQTSDFFTGLSREWEQLFVNDLKGRLVINQENSNISVCLLDSGVNFSHPLLSDLIQENHLDVIEPHWVVSDTQTHGHGTPMAGLIFYGDLSHVLDSTDPLRINHVLESVKIIERNAPNNPELYGKITLEAISLGEIINPRNKRVVCLAVTSQDIPLNGKPSSWSSAIDQISFGDIDERNEKNIIVISAGNTPLDARPTFPLSNNDFEIEDPAQAFNAITVGSYTQKDIIDYDQYPNATTLAQRGDMSPCNKTSVMWETQWAKKPDIVLEGGNDGMWNGGLFDHDSLKLLTTGIGRGNVFTTFGDTSASTALASKLIAELYSYYPDLWPETIRGLVIHSANWTDRMLEQKQIEGLTIDEKRNLLTRVGYGVPDLGKAMYSANNSLTLIAQRSLRPYKYANSRVQTNQFHLFDLPWPREVLLELGEQDVTLTITLSYFIEPNPGNKRYSNSSCYASHGLRFKMKGRDESETVFAARVSKTIREEEGNYVAEGREDWIIGAKLRDKGSVHKDYWKGSAADLATRNSIAIYPVGGWWKDRKKLERYTEEVKYSLIISISTLNSDIDLYTPVLVQNEINIDINV